MTLSDELRALMDALRGAISTEIAYQSARADLAARYCVRLLRLGLLVLALLFFAFMALVVGVLLALSATLGPWVAMALVVAGLLGAALFVVLKARASWRRLRRLFRAGGGGV